MKTISPLLFLLTLYLPCRAGLIKEVHSPSGDIKVSVSIDSVITYRVSYKSHILLLPSAIDMMLEDGRKLSGKPLRPKINTRSVNAVIVSPVPEKRKRIPDVYNEMVIRFTNGFGVVFRVHDDGIAYRITTTFRDSISIKNELAEFNFPHNSLLYFPEVVKRDNQDKYHTSFEEPYQVKPLDSVTENNLCFTPVLIASAGKPKIVITDADIEGYPGMFVTGNNRKALRAVFAPYPLEETVTPGDFPQICVSKRANYIARTKGTRSFPWRALLIAAADKDLPANDLVYRLASASRLDDVSWIRPGKATDEWIISANVFNVDFKSGINTATYKYYIDFAKRFGLERIMMDAGWSDNNDLFKINPAIDMEAIAAYAKKQNVKLSMWTLAMTLDKQLEPALEQFNKWGVDFIMTDFIDRDDQKAVDFFHKIAQACAKHRIMIMFHGAFKPAGFNRTYPHAVTREAVLGSEYNIWSSKATPKHNLLLPYIRMTAGPMDYEPGILDNATERTFRPIGEKVMSLGTRCQQLAMYVVYESPIQFFSGNPSQGLLEPDFMELLGSIPTTWDTTIVLDGRLGEYIITARKKNHEWFIGTMNDLSKRSFTVSLDFLENESYTATICEDGINADRYASDYRLYSQKLSPQDSVTITMAPGGGYLLRLRPQ